VATPFVGREAELAGLTADLEATLAGRGGVVLLAGEPGIGKTRLAEELATAAAARGALALWGRCWEGEGAPAFWPWVQIIRAHVQAADPAALRQEMGAGAADIAQLVPALRERLPDLPAPPPTEPKAARFRLFDSLAGFLRAAAARRPLLLVLDDLHWADAPSLALLRFVSRELEQAGPLVVGIYRHTEVDRGHPLVATLADLTRGRGRRLLLGGLDEHDVASFVALVAGVEPSPELAAAVHQQTDGNPFFVTEVVRLLASQGPLAAGETGSPALTAGLPEGVKAVVAERLGRLSGGCRRVLEVAAVFGRDFELRALQPASGLDAERLLGLLEEAEAARVIGAIPGGLGRWRFAHALVREVLYEGLPAARRAACTGASGRRWRRSMRPTRGRTWPSWPIISWRRRPAGRWPGRCGWPPWPDVAPWSCWPGRTRPACSSVLWPRWSWPSGLTSSSAASCCWTSGRPGWPPATWPPPAPPTSRPGSWPGGSARRRPSRGPA
jgi:predicted ATPase